tara:strand:+ start:3536 stop:4312 length:777 start_codon:yes stop_codon:yes gene_type:complete
MKIIVVSGGFDPIHSGHIAYLNSAKALGDILVVALNSNEWLIKKKGAYFLPYSERKVILESFAVVDEVIDFEDDKKGSAINALIKVKKAYPDAKIVFANGGDRNKDNIPELSVQGIEFAYGVGGVEKINSSSWILDEWKYPMVDRTWGNYKILFDEKQVKVKELIVEPREGMSFQKHSKRSELWLVKKGSCIVQYSTHSPSNRDTIELKKFDYFHVSLGQWHQIINKSSTPCHIIEIQYGEECTEKDIERLEHYSSKS